MEYKERPGGREMDEMRPIEIEAGILEKADGSAFFHIGNTKVIAGVYGPNTLHPRHMRKSDRAILRTHYSLGSFSVPDRARLGPSRRDKELSFKLRQALEPALFLEKFPKTVIDAYAYVLEADAGTRCACTTAISVALADAGLPMKGIVTSVAAGRVGDKVVLDLNKEEEDKEVVADIPVAYLPNEGKVTLLQMDGEISQDMLKDAVELGKEGCKKILEKAKEALREKYKE